MKILGIETSCDETAISLLDIEENENGTTVSVVANEIMSQIELHRPYGGVFPKLAKREHQKNLEPILNVVLERAGFSAAEKPAIDAIAVTQGPGLEMCLWTGIVFAKDLAEKWNIPLIPVNHMEGHILVALLRELKTQSANLKTETKNYKIEEINYPALALLISGGHTELVLMREIGKYEIVGKTRDDAVGECFDKTARLLGLQYPGGPEISKLAGEARKENLKLLPRESASDPHSSAFALPRPMMHSKDLDFSFSGLKTSVLYATKDKKLSADDIKKYAREIEEAITDVITNKVEKAIEEYSVESLIVGGGVIANTFIRSALQKVADSFDIPLYLPHISHSTDNALMIALAGYFNLKSKYSKDFGALGNLKIGLPQ